MEKMTKLTKREEKQLLEKFGLAVGDRIICVDDDTDEDQQHKAPKDLQRGKIYKIEGFDFSQVPNWNTHWNDKEFVKIQWMWTRVKLHGIDRLQYLDLFNKIEIK